MSVAGCVDTATGVIRSVVGNQTVAHQSTAEVYTATVTGCVVVHNLAILKAGIENIVLLSGNSLTAV